MRQLKIAACALLLLAGCASGDPEAVTTARNVCAIAYGDPALDPVRDKIPFDDDVAAKAPMTMLVDASRPNAAQRAALRQYDAANRRCWDAWDKAGVSPHVQQARAAVSGALAALYNGTSTFGEFNSRRAEAISQMRAAVRSERDHYGYGGIGGGRFSIGLGLFHW